jgi:hypothetical protein
MTTLTNTVLGNSAHASVDVATPSRTMRTAGRALALAGYRLGGSARLDLTLTTCLRPSEFDH